MVAGARREGEWRGRAGSWRGAPSWFVFLTYFRSRAYQGRGRKTNSLVAELGGAAVPRLAAPGRAGPAAGADAPSDAARAGVLRRADAPSADEQWAGNDALTPRRGGPTLLGLDLLVALGAAILVADYAARRTHLATPILLLAVGVLLGFIPVLRAVSLPPEAVLVLFLPALLYWEALTTSLREVRRDLRGIVLLSTVLVIATAAAVASVAHALDVPWGP